MPSHKASRTERRLRHTCGTSRRLEGAKPYGVVGWTVAAGQFMRNAG